MNVSDEDLKFQLEEFSLSADNKIIEKMRDLCYIHQLSAEDMVTQWVAYSCQKKFDIQPTLPLLDQMEKDELKKTASKSLKQRKSYAPTTPVYDATTIDLVSNDTFEEPGSKAQSFVSRTSNLFSPTSMSPASFTPSRKYNSRTGSGEAVATFGDVQGVEWKHSDEYSCSVKAYSNKTVLKESYNFMCEKLRDCGSILNDMIQEAAENFQKKCEIEEWGHIQVPSVETVPVVGRICSDNAAKLNASSLLLEGSQEMSSGHAVPLDVSQLQSFSFFPGQIIAGKGINNLGKKFVMHNVFEGIYPPPCEKVPDLANCFDSLSIVVACGPYTTCDSLSYEPFQDLMKYIKIHQPHVALLIGPFVDEKNEVIENGTLTETHEELFEKLIAEIITQIEPISTKVILIPSTRDVHHDFIYPTPPYKVKNSSKRLYLASDPCILDIEGVIVAVTSTDILFHLGKEEISYQQMPDRLGRLCSHILTQRNFYPLYPPNDEVNINYLRYELNAGIPILPHILILPSDFRYFIKDINGCCCINPERLTKRTTGGTFARIKIKPIDGKTYTGSIINSLQSEILKI
ncbi:DNA polymerase alpha subunit B-like [Uloborus diversus]|uniref:DNA polymerase alpha subunit B-like n=1 Tax=Uloborus diversus TaxID=327109 RepID=UPI00240A5B42|nr:DNA polymerase alpha subunit B-like [Uloborus diversus]